MTHLKATFYVVYTYKIFKYFDSIIIWKNHLLSRGTGDLSQDMAFTTFFKYINSAFFCNPVLVGYIIQLKHLAFLTSNNVDISIRWTRLLRISHYILAVFQLMFCYSGNIRISIWANIHEKLQLHLTFCDSFIKHPLSFLNVLWNKEIFKK